MLHNRNDERITVRPHKSIPLADGMPIVGSIKELSGDIRAFLTEQYLAHGPVFRIKVLHRSFTVLAGPDANQFAVRDGRELFSTKETWQEHTASFGAQRSLLTMDGSDHVRMRKIQRKGYSRGAIEAEIPRAVELAREQIREWPTNKTIPALYSLQSIIADQIGMAATGVLPREYMDDLIYFFRIVLLTTLTKQRPRILQHTPRFKRARKRVLELGQEVIDRHALEKQEDEKTDLIDDILKLAREEPDFLPQSDVLISVLGPFIAGLDTAASATSFMLYALLTHPDIMARACEEADRIFAQGELTVERMKEFDVIHRVVLETYRMYPISPALQRTAKKAFVFNNCEIPEGESIILATTVPHYLPDIYPAPEIFDIDRYTPERKENSQPGTFVPFGLGAHTCLGAGFAEVQMILTIATILHEAELVMDPPDYKLKIDPMPGPKPDDKFGFQVVRHKRI
ncbi:MAG: cytochrome P450 [Candidatus Thiodiazotropha sp. (ex Dulcina madagascariensis)]|nr:cytochrome P450 [Candidatus Thiodiazotropha sp. (ex Dulcina madagascariensis)]